MGKRLLAGFFYIAKKPNKIQWVEGEADHIQLRNVPQSFVAAAAVLRVKLEVRLWQLLHHFLSLKQDQKLIDLL